MRVEGAIMRRWIRRIAFLLLLVVAVLALRYTVFRDTPVPVVVAPVERGRVEETVTNSRAGTVSTRNRASLSPEIGGRVVELNVREGDRVPRGHVLLRLYDGDYRARVELQERSLETARVTRRESCLRAEQAQRDLERLSRLAEDELVSPERLEQAENLRDVSAAACDRADAQVGQAEAALGLARVDLEKTVLRAPFDGIVAELDTELGEWITPSPPGLPIPPVIDLIDPGAIYVSAQLDEVDVGRVRPDLPVRVTMDPYPDASFEGRVIRVAPYVQDLEEQNRTFEVEVELEDREFARTLLPGSSADIEVILDARERVLRIPSGALIEGGRVLVLRKGRLEAVPVEIGLRNYAYAEVLGGLEEGAPVVVSLDRIEVREGAAARADVEGP
jgi:HlyD family secretion protein